MKKIFSVVFIFFISLLSHFAQENKPSGKHQRLIDSLQQVLKSLETSGEFKTTIKGQRLSIEVDTTRIKTLNKLAWELRHINTDTAVALSTEALNLAKAYITYTSSSEKEQKQVRNEIYKLIGKSYVQLGVFAKENDNYSLALDYNFKALELFKEMEKDSALNPAASILERKSVILGNIGAIYADQGNYPKALEFNFQALRFSEILGDKVLMATKYTNIGIAYHYQNDHHKALEYHTRALHIAEQINNKAKIANSLSNIGIAYRHLGEYTKAINNHLKALEIDKELESDNNIARHYINIAGVYYNTRDFDKVLEYDFKALQVYEKLQSKSGIATALGNIGSTQILLKKYREAEENLQKALAISTEIKALSLVKDHEQFLYDLYQKSDKPDKALEHYIKYSALKDSIFNVENTKKTVRSEMSFEFEKKQAVEKAEQEKRNAIGQKEKQKQRIILFFVVGFLLLVAVFAAFMYNRWRITQKQKAIIEKQKEKIIDSITYAQFIQESILMEETEIQKHLPHSFIYFQPKDIVSGDFYWFSKVAQSQEPEAGRENATKNFGLQTSDSPLKTDSGLMIIAAVDCTGHGVPGAFMSMIGNTLLNQIVNEKRITVPSDILYHLNLGIYEALRQKKGTYLSRDGMDIALCCIDHKNKTLQYAGAQNPLYVLINSDLQIIAANKQSIGGGLSLKAKDPRTAEFTNHVIPIEEGMSIYLFSDGYKDQFGSDNKQKFGSQRFKDLIISNKESVQTQKELFATTFTNWKGKTPQTDDILVIGINFSHIT